MKGIDLSKDSLVSSMIISIFLRFLFILSHIRFLNSFEITLSVDDLGEYVAVQPQGHLAAEGVLQVVLDSLQLLEVVAVSDERLVFLQDGTVADHGKQLDGLEEVEVNVSRIVANQEIILSDVRNDFWKLLLVLLDGLFSVCIFGVAEADNFPSEFVVDAGKHGDLCLILNGLSEK